MDFYFFSIANTTSFTALIPTEGIPPATPAKIYSIWTSLPDGLNVVSKKLESHSAIFIWSALEFGFKEPCIKLYLDHLGSSRALEGSIGQ